MLKITIAGRAMMRPYQDTLRAMRLGSRGLLYASDMFKQFQIFFKKHHDPLYLEKEKHRGGATLAPSAFPLTAFCGSPADVEPFTILLMKVLCDLKQMEELRFLFAQCLSELDGTPSVELFNVYLAAISLTDTFNAHETDNVKALMETRGVVPDVVTHLSLFLLHLRLGRNVLPAWSRVHRAVTSVVESKTCNHYPLLELRLLHCFQVLFRLHHVTRLVQQCFSLVLQVCPHRLTKDLLVPFMVLSISNQAMPSAVVVQILQLMDVEPDANSELHRPSTGCIPRSPDRATGAPPFTPALHSETTAFRLLVKCASEGDVTSFHYVQSYIERCCARGFRIIREENEPVILLLELKAYTRAERMREIFTALDLARVDSVWKETGGRPKVLLHNRRIALATSDPVLDFIHYMATAGPNAIRSIATSLFPEFSSETADSGGSSTPSARISTACVEFLLAATAMCGDSQLSSDLLTLSTAKGLTLSPRGYGWFVTAALAYRPSVAVERTRWAEMEMKRLGIPLDHHFLRAAMEAALVSGDASLANSVAKLYQECGCRMDSRHATRLGRLAGTFDDGQRLRVGGKR